MTRRKWLSAFIAMGLGWLMIQPAARAEDPTNKTLHWLMNEPLTLLDWGVISLQNDMARASYMIMQRHRLQAPPTTGAFFDWRNRKILAYMSVTEAPGERTPERCRALFKEVVSNLLEGLPASGDQAGWYLENTFAHPGIREPSRPRNLGRHLLKRTSLEITMHGSDSDVQAGDWRRVQCSGRFDDDPTGIETAVTGGTTN